MSDVDLADTMQKLIVPPLINAHFFFVKDNGEGVPKDSIDSLFKKFYQLDTSHTRKHGGSGLGLTICRWYEGMGGKTWVESEECKGATFSLTVPKGSLIVYARIFVSDTRFTLIGIGLIFAGFIVLGVFGSIHWSNN